MTQSTPVTEPADREDRPSGVGFLLNTLMWIFLVWGIPAIIMSIFAVSGFIGRMD